jgi:hypothetical protein
MVGFALRSDHFFLTSFPAMLPRILPRTLRTSQPRGTFFVHRLYQNRKHGVLSPETSRNPTASAEQLKTSHPPSPKEVPLTIESHGPVIQNPRHAKNVVFLIFHILIVVNFVPDRYLSYNSQGRRRIGSFIGGRCKTV